MKKTSAQPKMPAADSPFVLNDSQGQGQNRALVSVSKEYRFEDFWGDDPILTTVSANEEATTSPEPEVASQPKRSWFARLIDLK